MIRHNITTLKCLGKLGEISVNQYNISTEHPFRAYHKKNELWLLGITAWPLIEVAPSTWVQSIYEDKPMIKTRDSGYKQGPILHDECTDNIIFFDMSRLTLQISHLELDGEMNLKSIDLRHFNRNLAMDTMLIIRKDAKLTCNLNVTRLNAVVSDCGLINTKLETRDRNGAVLTHRWQLDRLKLTLRDTAVVVGIRVTMQIVLCVPKTESSVRCGCDIIANNLCVVDFIGNAPKDNKNLRIFRQIDSTMLAPPPPPPPPPTPVMVESSEEDEEVDYFQEHVDNVVEEEYGKKKGIRFPMTSTVTVTACDFIVRRHDDIPCLGCMNNRCMFLATPCGHFFSCIQCLPGFQNSTSTCPKCRAKLTSAVFSVEAFNMPPEAFQITGPPSRDYSMSDHPDADACLGCLQRVAQVIFSCGHKISCLSCAQMAQSAVKPNCPMDGCNRPIISGVVFPFLLN